MKYNITNYVFMSVKSPETKNRCVFVTLKETFISTEGAAPLPQTLSGFYGSPERTNQTL